jgi:gas vesicle protein GvpL/GvpF
VAATAQERATAEYVYAVTWTACAIRAPSGGVGDAAVRGIVSGELAALTSPVESVQVRARRRDLTRHSGVIAAAFRNGTVIPLRFGTVFAGPEAVVDELLEPRRQELTRLLNELDGLAEVRVTALYREPAILAEIVSSEPRIARLREATRTRPEAASRALRLELGQLVASAFIDRADADARALVERLRPFARDVAVEERLTELEVVRASFLVELAELGRFDAALEEFARRNQDRMQLKEVGPLAPHSFVSLSESA